MNRFKSYNLKFYDNRIVVDGMEHNPDTFVMIDWENPLMKKHADVVTQFGGDILEIGFGMGISANYIQSNSIKSHTIVEIHPQILPKLYEWSKDKPNVRVIEGDWIDKLDEISSMKYDGIFFDTHMDPNAPKFRNLIVDKCLKEGGIFTWFDLFGRDFFGYDSINIIDVDIEYYGTFKCPYIFSNHQLK
jgi:hypothetical protein